MRIGITNLYEIIIHYMNFSLCNQSQGSQGAKVIVLPHVYDAKAMTANEESITMRVDDSVQHKWHDFRRSFCLQRMLYIFYRKLCVIELKLVL